MNFAADGTWRPKYRVGDVLRKEIGIITITGVELGPCVYQARITESPTHVDHDTRLTEIFLDDLPEMTR